MESDVQALCVVFLRSKSLCWRWYTHVVSVCAQARRLAKLPLSSFRRLRFFVQPRRRRQLSLCLTALIPMRKKPKARKTRHRLESWPRGGGLSVILPYVGFDGGFAVLPALRADFRQGRVAWGLLMVSSAAMPSGLPSNQAHAF